MLRKLLLVTGYWVALSLLAGLAWIAACEVRDRVARPRRRRPLTARWHPAAHQHPHPLAHDVVWIDAPDPDTAWAAITEHAA
jgi:hypothetical protein